MRIVLLLAVMGFALGSPGSSADRETVLAPSSGKACVVLLHGLGRTYRSMNALERAAERAGYTVVNIDYPSRKETIEKLAAEAVPDGLRRCREAGAAPVHFVTHSMGGLLVRYYLERHRVSELGRVVMLSPPNHGSEAADALRDEPMYQWWNGPAGQQLGTGPEGIAARLGAVAYPLGIITGNRHAWFDARRSKLIPGDDDGKVSVERAKVAGMTDFLVLPATHTFIMLNDDAIAQTLHFLRHGRFRHESASNAN